MPKRTVAAAATSLPNLNRRTALAKLGLGLAASTTLAASAIAAPQASAVSPELLRLIEACTSADAAHAMAVDRKFEASHPSSGLSVADLDRISRDRDLAWDAWYDAVTALCAFVPSTLEEANLKFRYVFADDGVGHDGLWDDHIAALLQSLTAEA